MQKSKEYEEQVLGAILLDGKSIYNVTDILEPEDFFYHKNKLIFEKMLYLFNKSEPIDLVTVEKELNGKVEASYLADLYRICVTSNNAKIYANYVKEESIRRNIKKSASEMQESAEDRTEKIDDIIDKANKSIYSLSTKATRQEAVSIDKLLFKTFDKITDLQKNKGKLRGIKTGFNDLDKILSGIQNSDLIILAARPSMGKTSFALDIARQVAKQKIPVGIFSLEMSSDQLTDRLLASQSNVGLWKIKTGNLNQNDNEKLAEGMGELSEFPIFVDDNCVINITQLRTNARRLKMENKLGLIIIDYLQLMEGKGTENRTQEVSEISRGLKILAKELDIPIIALSQLSRATEMRQDQRPKLSDLRESGAIEQDADIVMFIYRDKRVNPESQDNMAEIIISKHRNGATGKVNLFWDENVANFKNLVNV